MTKDETEDVLHRRNNNKQGMNTKTVKTLKKEEKNDKVYNEKKLGFGDFVGC